MIRVMARSDAASLNESGEMLVARIVRGAALYACRSQQTLSHSPYAWKVHIGLDAPVWFDSAALNVDEKAGVRAVVVPPGLEHRVGAIGLALTILVSPGTHSTAWCSNRAPLVPQGAQLRRIVDAGQAWQLLARHETDSLVSELLGLAIPSNRVTAQVDVRVRRTMARLNREPGVGLQALARDERLSLDRLSHLVARDTGTTLRRHALWSRLMCLLSSNKQFPNISAAAADAGFADHAHMTRSYRSLLGRLPSEFTGPPDAIASWAGD
jgi:AraC-like DNA-binding protein